MMVFKTKGPQIVAFFMGGEGRLHQNRNCEEQAGSDKRFENTTLFLD